jgi:multimeric flavodoxin WrbA
VKLLTLFGSPRTKGNTAALLNSFLEGVKGKEGVEVELINLNKKDIKPCQGCESCRKPPYLECIINDDIQDLHKKVIETDILVFATPVYWWNISAQLKLFIDRLYALAGEEGNYKCLHGKKIVILMTYQGSDPNSGAKLVVDAFKDIAEYLKMDIVGVLGVCSQVPVKENQDALNKAFKLGEQVIEQ